MKLDDIEKLIAAATPGPWPKEYGHCDFPDNGLMACGPIITGYDEEADENQAQADQDFIRMARELMPKLLKVVRTLEWIAEHSIVECGRWTEAVMKSRESLAELEKP